MSYQGVHEFAAVLSEMQTKRVALMRDDTVNVRLAQLLAKAHDAIKDDFTRMTNEPGFPNGRKLPRISR